MQKYKTGFLVGRFQPFHKGHLRLIRQSLERVEKIIIGIGSVGVKDENNYLGYSERVKIIRTVFKKEGWIKRLVRIVPLKDFHNDKLWLEHCLKEAGNFDVVISNNEWTNRIFANAGYPVLRLGFYKRYLYEGVKIRKLMKENGDWEERVPDYIIKLILRDK